MNTKDFCYFVLPLLIISSITLYHITQLSDDEADSRRRFLLYRDKKKLRLVKQGSPDATKREVTTNGSPSATTETTTSRVLRLQKERKERIEKICSENKNMQRKTAGRSSYLYNTKDKYLYCPVPKAGWSSWKRLWFYTSGVIKSYDTDVGIRNDRDAGVVSVSESSKRMKDKSYKYSFVFFRNPWERLVSAYINKAVEYNYSRILHSPCKWESMKPYKPNLTFLQFLICIVDGSTDMHWMPQWSLCNVCSFKFDFIGHLETVDDDAAFVLDKLGINATYPHSFASKKYSTKKVMEEWYKEIPTELLRRLLIKFQYDFELHGYSKRPPGRPDIS